MSGERLVVGVRRAALLVLASWSLGCGGGTPRGSAAVIERELVAPYVAALNAGDTERAWREFTTSGYRASTGEIAYTAAQARNQDEYGLPVHVTLLPDEPVPLVEPGHPPMLRVTVRWEGARRSAAVVLDLVDEPPWRIERTWAWPDDGLGTERVY